MPGDNIGNYFTLLNKPVSDRKTTILSSGSIKLQFLFDIEKLSVKLLIVFGIAIFSGFCNFLFLERTGLYSLGINSIFQSIARCASYFLKKNNYAASSKVVHSLFFWVTTLCLNIPLAFVGYRKIGKNFTLLTLFFLIFSTLTSLFLSSLPASYGLKDFYIFSDPRTFNTCLLNDGINILQWSYIGTTNGSNVSFSDSSKVALIFVYGIVFGLLNTFTSLFIYALGGSTGGLDWIVFYFVKKHSKPMPNSYFYISMIVTFLSYIIGTYAPYAHHIFNPTDDCKNSITSKHHSVASNLIGPMFVSTMLAITVRKICFSLFYPRFKLVNVKIFTNQIIAFRGKLLEANFPHSFTINPAIGGYLLREQNVLELICFALELKNVRDCAEQVDPGCLIIATPIKSWSGKFTVRHNLN